MLTPNIKEGNGIPIIDRKLEKRSICKETGDLKIIATTACLQTVSKIKMIHQQIKSYIISN